MPESSDLESPAARDLESPAARLVDALLDAGEVVDDGHFTLDPAAAAAKLEKFAYSDRGRYLLALVEGLLGLGASSVSITTAGEDLWIVARQVRVPDAERSFAEIYARVFSRGADASGRALARLAIGVDMLLGIEASKSVQLRYSSEASSIIAEYRRGVAPTLGQGEAMPAGELRIIIDRAWSLGGSDAERDKAIWYLREAVRFSTVEIELDGQRISQASRRWRETLRGEGPGFRFTAGLEQGSERSSGIELWSAGVCVEVLRGPGWAFRAAVELDVARRDLSQARVVRDEAVERALAAVEQAHAEALRRLELDSARWTNATRPAGWSKPEVVRALGRRVRGAPSQQRSEPSSSSQRADGPTPSGPVSALKLMFGIGTKSPAREMLLYFGALIVALALVGIIVGIEPLVGERDATPLLVSTLALMVGALLPVPMLRLARRAIRARDHGAQVPARVCGFESTPKGYGHVVWAFEDASGATQLGRSLPRPLAEAEQWQSGMRIDVYWHPDDPTDSWWDADVGARELSTAPSSR